MYEDVDANVDVDEDVDVDGDVDVDAHVDSHRTSIYVHVPLVVHLDEIYIYN